MAAAKELPDLVVDTKLRVEVHRGYTQYLTVDPGSGSRRQWRKETWRTTQCLGAGATGQVWLEECSQDGRKGQLQAVKIMPKRGGTDYYRELEAIAKFSQGTSKYEGLFVKSHGWYETEQSVFIVMEYLEHGSLASHLSRPLPEDEVKHITFQVLEGLSSLHESGFVHRDIKSDNILVASKGPRWWVKIGDFGFSKRLTEDNNLQTIVGTQNYLAPEILGLDYETGSWTVESCYTCAVDMWSLGVTIFYMLCHSYPFQDRELLAYTQGASFPSADLSLHNVTKKGHAFIAALLTADASSRLSAQAALRDQWLTGLEEDFRATAEEVLPSCLSETPGYPFATESSRSWPMDSTIPPMISKLTVVEPPNAPPQRPSYSALARGRDELDLDALRTLHAKGVEHKNRFELKEAEILLQQAVDGFEIVLGPNNNDTLDSKVDLGKVHLLQHRFNSAHLLFVQAAEGFVETRGRHHQDTLLARFHVSRSLFRQGKFSEAQDLVQQVIVLQKAVFGEENRDTIHSTYLASEIYYHQRNYSAAAILLTELLDLLRKAQGPENLLHHVLRDLGCCQYFRQMYKGAQAAFQELVDRDTREGPKTPAALWNILWLVDSLYKQGIVDQAQPLLWRVLASSPPKQIERGALKLSHAIGVMIYARAQFQEAQGFLQQAADGRKQLLGPTHEATLDSFLHLGKTLVQREIYAEAEALFDDLIDKYEMVYGPHDTRTMTCRMWLGASLLGNEDPPAAHDHLDFAALHLSVNLGAEHEDTVQCNQYLGLALHLQGMDEEAAILLQETLAIQKRVLDPDDYRIVVAVAWLREVLSARQKSRESEPTSEEALETTMNHQLAQAASTDNVPIHKAQSRFSIFRLWDKT
ncbi:kinase-like domain-containing protein [Aspergillus carlsbadensis]|nr:kinase-like domain-containing protein [Aspergillus carlsbadensis]